MAAIITLTTDFGARDPYVAAMKGVLRKRCPDAVIDDLTHEISPHDIMEALLFLEGAVPWYPEEAVHVVVVDPGVGTPRRPLALSVGGRRFIGPDNGLFSMFLAENEADWMYAINPDMLDVAVVSNTFHGRDIFAPAAAWLTMGLNPALLGAPVLDPVRLPLPETLWLEATPQTGLIVHIDRFGNCITNIRRRQGATVNASLAASVGNKQISLRQTYGEAPPGALLALFGSSGRLELAANQDSAARLLGLSRGDTVQILYAAMPSV